MNYTDRSHYGYACYDTPHLALTWRLSDASLAFLGLESGGRRSDHKNTYNLLKPSFGAHATALSSRRGPAPRVRRGPDGLRASGDIGSLAFVPEDDRAFRLDFAVRGAAKTLPKTFFEASLSIATAPPTIWADTTPAVNPQHPKVPRDKHVRAERVWQLPMLVHFPDFGTLRIESAGGDIECRERLIASSEMSGLNLGFQNMEGHAEIVGLHHGISRLEFRLRKPGARRAALRFTVVDEIAPRAPFTAAPAWNGFRRAWLNNFALNRRSLSMGDNIELSGVAHLCVHHKADMLCLCNPDDHPVFGRIREALVNTLDTSFEHCQAADGEIGWEYGWHPKAPGQLTTPFIDCTPSNLIAGLVALRWAPDRASRWIGPMLRAADFLMRLDTDGDGLVELPYGGTGFREPWNHPGERPRIWWDNIFTGHKDAWFNLWTHRALRMLAPVARAQGREADAVRIEAFLRPFRESLLRELYNPETGLIAGWRDINGRLHDYKFTFCAALAVTEGVLTRAEGRKMLRILLRAMREAGFGDNRFGIPGNTVPIPLCIDTFDWPFMGEWPRYENGGCCGMTAWLFLNALYAVGMEKEADAIYFRMLETFETMPTHSGLFPAYMESCDWRTKDGNSCGYNYLADNYLFLASGFLHHAGKTHPAIVL